MKQHIFLLLSMTIMTCSMQAMKLPSSLQGICTGSISQLSQQEADLCVNTLLLTKNPIPTALFDKASWPMQKKVQEKNGIITK